MRLKHIQTGQCITVPRQLYYKLYYSDEAWLNVTPAPTQKQIEAQDKFVKIGKLARTKSNLEDVQRTFNPPHELFKDAIIQLDAMIKARQ